MKLSLSLFLSFVRFLHACLPRPQPDPLAFFDKMKRGSPGRSRKIAEITNNVRT